MIGNIIFSLTAIIITATDQFTKYWISSVLSPGQSLWSAGFFRIALVYNSGSAFGLFQGGISWLCIVRTIGAILIIGVVITMNRRLQYWGGKWVMFAVGLLLAGTVGNLIDSFRLGYVVDFLDLSFWPTFNVADSSVVVAMCIIVFMVIRQVIAESRQAKSGR
jgi:signal peptidase II